MIDICILSCIVSIILLTWFRTSAFVEYCKLFSLTWVYKDYELRKKEDARLTYLLTLRQYKNCFVIRLITCPICLSVWISIILSLVFSNIIFFPLIMIGGLFIYGILNKLLD